MLHNIEYNTPQCCGYLINHVLIAYIILSYYLCKIERASFFDGEENDSKCGHMLQIDACRHKSYSPLSVHQ
jgi:hypothetical protein